MWTWHGTLVYGTEEQHGTVVNPHLKEPTFVTQLGKGEWLPPPSDFQNEPLYVYFGTNG